MKRYLDRIVGEQEVEEQQRLATAAPALIGACKAALLILNADGHTDPWGERRAIREKIQAALALAESLPLTAVGDLGQILNHLNDEEDEG